MLSRVADSFYWLSRSLERAEHSARVINVHLSLTLDDPTDKVGQSLLAAIGHPVTDPDAADALPLSMRNVRWRWMGQRSRQAATSSRVR